MSDESRVYALHVSWVQDSSHSKANDPLVISLLLAIDTLKTAAFTIESLPPRKSVHPDMIQKCSYAFDVLAVMLWHSELHLL